MKKTNQAVYLRELNYVTHQTTVTTASVTICECSLLFVARHQILKTTQGPVCGK